MFARSLNGVSDRPRFLASGPPAVSREPLKLGDDIVHLRPSERDQQVDIWSLFRGEEEEGPDGSKFGVRF
jgi:hypothetical protein